MKAVWLTSLLILGMAAFTVVAQMDHDHDTHDAADKGSTHKSSTHKGSMAKSDAHKVRCALDGMMMNASAMVPMEHGDETLYFCNDAHQTMFQENPKRHLKKVMVGDNHIAMHILTIKEYKGMMESMGMGKMVKIDDPNATHYLSVHPMTDRSDKEDMAGFALKVIEPDGKSSFHELKYDKMMKSYVGTISLLKSGDHKLRVLLASPEVEVG